MSNYKSGVEMQQLQLDALNDIAQLLQANLQMQNQLSNKLGIRNILPKPQKNKSLHHRKSHGKSTKARPVRLLNPITKTVIAEYPSMIEGARCNGVSDGSVWISCNTGKVVKGTLFEYA